MIINMKTIEKLSKISNSFYEDFKIEFLFHSNKLEGSTFTLENLQLLLEKKIVAGEHFYDDVIETRNSLELFNKVIDSLGEPIDKYLLFDWHRTLKKNSVDDEIGNIGKWKQYDNRLRGIDIKLTSPNMVESEIYNLLSDWNESNKGINDIACFHSRFEQIHPFQDGNGRIGRFIILKQCIENKVDLISIDEKYEKEYKSALYYSQKSRDMQKLVTIFEKCSSYTEEKFMNYIPMIKQIYEEDLSEDSECILDI